MGENITPARRETYCDRCRMVFDPSKKQGLQNVRKITTTTVTVRYRIAGVFHGNRDRGPQVLVSNVDLCDSCQWEFDMLFLQGLQVPPHPAIRQYPPSENPYPQVVG